MSPGLPLNRMTTAQKLEAIDEMMEKVKEARDRRDALAAQAGRTDARASMGEVDDLFVQQQCLIPFECFGGLQTLPGRHVFIAQIAKET